MTLSLPCGEGLLIYLLTFFLTPRSRVILEKPTVLKLVKKYRIFYGTRKFITLFISASHLFLSWASSIQSIPPHFTSWRSILYYPPVYAWVSQVVSFPQVSPPKTCKHLCSPHTCYMPLPSSFSRFDHPKKMSEQYRPLISSLCTFLHSPVTLSLLGPNILLNTLFSNTLSLCFSLNVNDQVSHPKNDRQHYSSAYLNL
jgi:hypothetical protein